MINIKGKSKVSLVIGLLIVGLGLAVMISKVRPHFKIGQSQQEVRKTEIAKGVQGIFKGCPDVSTMEKRRECFKSQLTEMRSKNKKVKTEYVIEMNGKKVSTKSEDLGDLIKITKPAEYGFARCISNTFFFDWQNDSIYLSFENALGSALCTTTKGEKVLVMPKDLNADEVSLVKQMFQTPIN